MKTKRLGMYTLVEHGNGHTDVWLETTYITTVDAPVDEVTDDMIHEG